MNGSEIQEARKVFLLEKNQTALDAGAVLSPAACFAGCQLLPHNG